MNEALRDWVANVHDTFYIIGTAAGPHPYPELVRDFQSVIGTRSARADARAAPAACPTCWSRRSAAAPTPSACSTRSSTIPTSRCSASRRRATGSTRQHAASLAGGFPGILHGNKTYLLQDEDGQITEAHSISAGLDYPGIGPEHAWLKETGRVEYTSVTDDEALDAFQLLCRTEGIIPALEPSHAIAAIVKRAREMPRGRDHPRQPVRPRRQGHLHRRRGAGSGDVSDAQSCWMQTARRHRLAVSA